MTDPLAWLTDLEGVSSIIVTHQLRDAFWIAMHEGVAGAEAAGREVHFRKAPSEKLRETVFLMLRDGRFCFEGDARELIGS